jgi:zinc protease
MINPKQNFKFTNNRFYLISWGIFFNVIICISQTTQQPFKYFSLENGLDVMVVENHLVPVATIMLAVRNGSFTEGPEYAGLSHLYEHMFFKGNDKYSTAQKFGQALSNMGALYNAVTREEVVYYYFSLPAENIERGMETMSNTVQTPLFDQGELSQEIEVVLGEFDRHESNPFFPFNRVMDSVMWGDCVTRKQALGQRPVIKSATTQKMKNIQKKYYIPNNSLLVVGGDIDSATISNYVNKYFNSWKRGPNPFEKNIPPRAKPIKENKLITVEAPVTEALVNYQWHGPSIGIDNAATYAADVFIFILQQPNSRFQRKLVESGIAQSAGISYYTQRYVGPIAVQMSTSPEKIVTANKILWDEIQAFDSPDYFTDEELEISKSTLQHREIFEREETSDWLSTPSFWWSTTGIEYYKGYLDNLGKVIF